MQTDFDKAFGAFKNLAYGVAVHWQLWRELKEPDVMFLFHETGRGFYHIVENSLLSNVVIGLGAAMDKATVCGDDCLSARWILEQDAVKHLHTELEAILNPLLEMWKNGPAKYRHKVLAHNDQKVFTDQVDFPDFLLRDLEHIKNGLWDFVRKIEGDLYHIDLSRAVHIAEGLPHILRYLKLGLEAQKERLKG